MTLEKTLLNEIEESKKWLDRETDDSTYKRDLQKRIELLNWVLEKMNNPDIFICEIIESKINEIRYSKSYRFGNRSRQVA